MEKETRNEKFRRLAQVRVGKVVEDIRKLANLSSNNYDYSEQEVDLIFDFIKQRLKEAEAKFKGEAEAVAAFNFENLEKS